MMKYHPHSLSTRDVISINPRFPWKFRIILIERWFEKISFVYLLVEIHMRFTAPSICTLLVFQYSLHNQYNIVMHQTIDATSPTTFTHFENLSRVNMSRVSLKSKLQLWKWGLQNRSKLTSHKDYWSLRSLPTTHVIKPWVVTLFHVGKPSTVPITVHACGWKAI